MIGVDIRSFDDFFPSSISREMSEIWYFSANIASFSSSWAFSDVFGLFRMFSDIFVHFRFYSDMLGNFGVRSGIIVDIRISSVIFLDHYSMHEISRKLPKNIKTFEKLS